MYKDIHALDVHSDEGNTKPELFFSHFRFHVSQSENFLVSLCFEHMTNRRCNVVYISVCTVCSRTPVRNISN